jgi:hypothetical protein
MAKLFTAIIVNQVPGFNQPQFVKYRNIPESKMVKLCAYVRKTFQGYSHINLYEKRSKAFVKQLNKADIESGLVGQL